MACEAGHTELIDLIVDKAGPSTLQHVCKHGTPIHASVLGQDPAKVLECILDLLEDSEEFTFEDLVNTKDLEGIHPLYLSVHSGNIELTQIMLECGADPIQATEPKHGKNLLHVVAELGHDELAQIILDANPALLS